MSWTALVAQMIEDLNPKLKGELVQEGGVEALEDWVRMSARWMADTYHNLSAGSPMQAAAAREVVIAQMREEITSAGVPIPEEEEESIPAEWISELL